MYVHFITGEPVIVVFYFALVLAFKIYILAFEKSVVPHHWVPKKNDL